jgi:phosphopantothenoylcysteine decarboxylase/phosphopantothenate--cysteine ligase
VKSLTNKRIILGVSGSIAAYKAPSIIRRLQDIGAQVKVILTQGGAKFITKLSLQITSKNKVYDNLWDEEKESIITHIELAKWADVILIAPASANTIYDLANAKANNLLTNVVLASDAKMIIAPAMNQQMYKNITVKENIQTLIKRKVALINPSFGNQACGDIGQGTLADPKLIAAFVADTFKNTLITLGATVEEIDPVRFISNKSSGKMGLGIANACIEAGAKVTVIYGNITTKLNDKCDNIKATTAEQMYKSVMENIKNQDIFIACAAVNDYKAKNITKHKIKKTAKPLILELIPTKDILKDVCKLNKKPISIGFAAETENFIQNAKAKLKNKNCDAIILNNVAKSNLGFENDENEIVFIDKKSVTKIKKNSKTKLGVEIVKIIKEKFL